MALVEVNHTRIFLFYSITHNGSKFARRCLACRAQRGPLGVLPKAKRPRYETFWSQRETKHNREPSYNLNSDSRLLSTTSFSLLNLYALLHAFVFRSVIYQFLFSALLSRLQFLVQFLFSADSSVNCNMKLPPVLLHDCLPIILMFI